MSVEPRLKPKVECPDGCGRFGTPMRNGHIRGCPCRSCMGRRNKYKGQRKQRAAAKAVGITVNRMGAGHEENYQGALRVEVKAGAKAKPVDTQYRLARAQSEQSRPVGDPRPFAFLAMPDGMKHGYLVVRTDDLEAVVAAIAENYGWMP